MKKILFIFLFIPTLVFAQTQLGAWDSWSTIKDRIKVELDSLNNMVYINVDYITVSDSATLNNVTIDSLVVNYVDADYIDADSIMLQATGCFYFGSDKDTYLKEVADDSVQLVVNGIKSAYFTNNGTWFINRTVGFGGNGGINKSFADSSGNLTIGVAILPDSNLGADFGTAETIIDSIFVDNLNVTTDIVNAGVLTNNGETNLGDAITDTIEHYGLTNLRADLRQFSTAPSYYIWDSDLNTNTTIDTAAIVFEASDSPTITFYGTDGDNFYIGMNTSDAMLFVNAMLYKFDNDMYITDDQPFAFGSSQDVRMQFERADTDARALISFTPEGDASYTTTFIYGDASINNVDLGWFNGIIDPSIAIVSDLADGAMRIIGQVAIDSMAGFKSHGVNKGMRFYDDMVFDSTLTLKGQVNPNSAQLVSFGTAALPFNLFFTDSIDANYADITDAITSMTIGGAYIYRVGGTDVGVADGGTNLSAYDKGEILLTTAANTIAGKDWTGAGNYIVSGADSTWTTASLLTDAVAGDGIGGGSDNVLLGSDVDITFAVLLDADGGLETTDDSINIKLDGVTLTSSATGLKVTDNTYQPLEATLTDIADGTIIEDLVNTTAPWADNEIASSATWNARLDSAIIVVWADTGSVIATISDTTVLSTRISGKSDSGSVLYLAQDETITGEVTFDSDTTKFSNLASVFYLDSVLTFYSKATTPANGFVEFVRSDGSGAFIIGRTSATAPSTVGITDGGGDNEPGTIQLYTDGGTAIYLHSRTDGRLRFENALPVDDDVATNLILTFEDTVGVLATISDTTVLSTRISGKADSGAVGYLAQAETIAGDWVNTASPWADNEVADNITCSGYLPLSSYTYYDTTKAGFNRRVTDGDFVFDGDSPSLGTITITGAIKHSVTATITAVTPGAQGDGLLTTEINEVSAVANANDAVTLPNAIAGLEVFIINNGANTLEIWPYTGDDLGAGVNTATTLAAGSNVTFVAYNATNWEIK